MIESALDWISFAGFNKASAIDHVSDPRSMIIILECWALFNGSFYDESVVLITSMTINFRENVIATFTNHLPQKELSYMLFRKDERFGPFAKQFMNASACCQSKC